MSFCTKCGQEIMDGEIHNCPADPNRQNMGARTADGSRQGAGVQKGNAFKVSSEGSRIDVSIDKDKMKEKYDSFVEKITSNEEKVAQDNAGVYERNKKIVPECTDANDGEIPVKQYNLAKLRSRITFSKAEGRLQITNKRIIFRATGRSIIGKTVLHEEFKINEIAGVEIRNNPRFSLLNLLGAGILTILCGGVGFVCAMKVMEDSSSKFGPAMAILYSLLASAAWIFLAIIFHKNKPVKRYYILRHMFLTPGVGAMIAYMSKSYFIDIDPELFYIPIAIAGACALINLVLICILPNLIVLIKTKGATPGLQIRKASILNLLLGRADNDNTGFSEVMPWYDTDAAIREVGAIIDDIQTIGDAAIAKWAE